MRHHGRYPRDPSIACSKDLFAWLEAHPDEWAKLQGRYVAFHKEEGVVVEAADIFGVIQTFVRGEIDPKKLLVRSVPRRV